MPESSIDSCRRMLIIGSNDLEQANYMGNEVTKKDLQALQKKVDDLNRFWDQSLKFDASIKKLVEELQKKCSK